MYIITFFKFTDQQSADTNEYKLTFLTEKTAAKSNDVFYIDDINIYKSKLT